PGRIAAGAVAGDGEEPGRESVAVLERCECPEAADERLLDHVIGLVRIELREARREARHRRPVTPEKLFFGSLAAQATGEGAADQDRVVHPPIEQRQMWADRRFGELSSRAVRRRGHELLAPAVPMPSRASAQCFRELTRRVSRITGHSTATSLSWAGWFSAT